MAGYFSLSAYAVLASELPEELAGRLPRLGELLLVEALARTLENSGHVASFAVVVDALNDQAAEFYQRYGFLPFADDGHRLHLPMATAKALLGKALVEPGTSR